MKIKDLIHETEALPVEERAPVVDSLLRSLNPPESKIDEKWAAVAAKRLKEVRSSWRGRAGLSASRRARREPCSTGSIA